MDIGRRQNADPRWLLPLLCRRGHITKNEVGAIRIGANETHFQIPRAVAGKFSAATARTVGSEDGDEPAHIDPSEAGPRENARANRTPGRPPPARAPPYQPRPATPAPAHADTAFPHTATRPP